MEAASVQPRRLTTTVVPTTAIGKAAAEGLVARLKGERCEELRFGVDAKSLNAVSNPWPVFIRQPVDPFKPMRAKEITLRLDHDCS